MSVSDVATRPVNVLSLCTGVAGLDLALRVALGSTRLICCVEHSVEAAAVLAARMESGALDAAPIWSDLRTFDGRPWRGLVDMVTGGYPCQPFSLAGRRVGEDDPRHLWPDIARIVRECEPQWCFFENVPGHITLGLDTVRGDLADLGYRVEIGLYSAEEVGAPHRRDRLYILAHMEHTAGIAEREPDDQARTVTWGGARSHIGGGRSGPRRRVQPEGRT